MSVYKSVFPALLEPESSLLNGLMGNTKANIMKRTSAFICLVLLMAVAMLLVGIANGTFGAATDSYITRVGSELEFEPYAFIDENGQPAGFSVDLIRAVADAMDLSINISSGTWNSVWNDLAKGRLDVLPIVAKLSERTHLVDFSLPHTETYDAFFVRQGDPIIQNIEGAIGKEIVVMRSDAAHHALQERNFQGRQILVDTIPEGLLLISTGKHDAFLCSKLIGVLAIKKHKLKGLAYGPPIQDYKRVFSFAVKKGDAELLEKLNQGLLIIKASGEYEQIYNKWLNVEAPWRKFEKYLMPIILVVTVVVLIGGFWLFMLKRLVSKRTRELAEKNELLRQATVGLEAKVVERTAELVNSNEMLKAEITERKQAEKEKETLMHNMGERVKELQCLYSIAESIRPRETIKEIFMDILALIPTGWHYPDITRGKIRFEEQDYVTEPFEETEWRQTSDILIKGKRSGFVEVYYLEERPELDEGPFLSEERNLINGIAHTISETIERNQAEEELKNHRDNLNELVKEKTKELQETYLQLNAEIEEKLNYQAEALRAAELAALGELAAGVAHEINNPVNGIINYAQMIAEMQGPNRKENEIANNIIHEGDRIANIVTSLLSFARAHEGEKSSIQINEVVSEIISLSGAQLRKDGIKLTVDMPTDLPLIHANFQQLEQVFLNIINNARYATNKKYPDRKTKKRITIKGESTAIDSKTIVRLTVSDNGVGIPYEILGKIMNPFFTTKPANQGTGLGLSISHGIINDHGGTLKIDSVYGEFTNVIINLPANIISY